jgi:hypothetical protein
MSLATELQAIIDQISDDEALLYTFVNGDINTVVNGAGGTYPSLAKMVNDFPLGFYTKGEIADFLALKATIESPTFTGTVTAPLINAGTIDFDPANTGGELSWNNVEKTLDLVTGSDNVTIQLGQEVVLYARNKSGLQMTDGQVVKVVGSQGNNPTIALAQADTSANARGVIGVVTQIIPNNSNGFISLIGKVRDLTLDSGTYTVGDLLYLSSTVAGGLTKVRPDIGVAIGRVIATSNGNNNAGVLEVSIDSEVAVHELEQQLLILINELYLEIASNRSYSDAIWGDVLDLQPRYPYTTSISNGIGTIKNVQEIGFTSGYRNDDFLTSVALGANCTALNDSAFQSCENLVEFYFNSSTTGIIGDSCFQNCINYGKDLTGNGFTLGKNITGIGIDSYRGCVELVVVELSQYDIGSIGKFAFEGCSKLNAFTFPWLTGETQNPFTVIPESVLRNCIALTTIEIPSQITNIHGAAFYGCSSLSTIRCYATTAPALTGTNHFFGVSATAIQAPIGAEAGWPTVYAGLPVQHVL